MSRIRPIRTTPFDRCLPSTDCVAPEGRTEDEDSGSTELAEVLATVAFAVEGRQLWDKRSRDGEEERSDIRKRCWAFSSDAGYKFCEYALRFTTADPGGIRTSPGRIFRCA